MWRQNLRWSVFVLPTCVCVCVWLVCVCVFNSRVLKNKISSFVSVEARAGSSTYESTRRRNAGRLNQPFTDEAQTALFKDPVRTAQ
jgi:hypothetical protein